MIQDAFEEISSTDELLTRTIINPIDRVQTAIQSLPYDRLSNWKDFERLCLRLAQEVNGGNKNDTQLYKKEGSKQDGIDIAKIYRDEGFFDVYQCKKYQKFSKNDFLKAVNEVKKNQFWGKIRKFYICTSSDLSIHDKIIDDLKIELYQENIELNVWDSKRLDIELKKYPQLVFEFFDGGLKPNFVEHFCGLDKIRDLFYNIKKRQYSPIENYIPRKLLRQDSVQLYKQDETDKSLIQLFENKSKSLRISILSTAGDGKTSELQQLASHFSKITSPDSLFPILIRLKDYVDEDLHDLLEEYCPDWKKIKPERLLVIFDGYDEVKDTVKEDLNRKISRLANSIPLINIVVSSRNNGIDKEIDQFETYYLQKLSIYGEVRDYIWGQLNTKTDPFIHLMFQNKMDDLLLTPFYLVKLTELYHQSAEDFPQNRIEIFDRIISLTNKKEIDSNRISWYEWEDIEDTQNALLSKVSTTMLLMGRNLFISKEYKAIVTDKIDRTILEKSPLFKKHKGNVEFTHNLFQEYLTAKLLSKQSFDTIKKCISFEPDFVKIKPKWTNTLSSLFSLLPKDSIEFKGLLAFIMESDHSLLIRFEHDKISLDERFEIFKEIIESTDKDYRNYSYDELIHFAGIGENEQVLKYLLEHINPKNQKKTRELTYLLNRANPDNLFGLEKEIETVLKTILSDKSYDDEIHEDALRAFYRFKLYNSELIEWLMIHKPSFEFKNILCVVFELINELDVVDKYIDFYLDSIPICNKELVKNDVIRNTGVRGYFYKGIHKVKLTMSLHKILDYVIENYDELERRDKIFCEDDFKREFAHKFFTQLIKGYNVDKTLFNKVAKLIEQKLYKSYNREIFITAEPFFKETETTEKAFWYFWDNKKNREIRWYIRSLFTSWIDKPIIDKWVKRYNQKYYNDADINDLKLDLVRNDQQELLHYFLKKINAVSDTVHDYPVFEYNDDEEGQNKRKANDLEFLLNKSKFLETVSKILEMLGDNISQESIRDLEYKEKPFNCHLPFNYIQFYFRNGNKITDFSEIINDINDEEKWKGYVITELRRRINDKEESPSLPENHINYLKEWCYTLLPSLNFKNAKWNVDGQEYWRQTEEYFAYFFQHIQLEVSQEIMIDMIMFDSYGLYDWKESDHHKIPPLSDIVIQKISNDELIRHRILENLSKVIEVSGVLGNHFRLCRKLNIYEAKPYMLNAIKNNIFEPFYAKILIDIYLESKGAISDFEFRLNDFSPMREDHWYILEKLSTKEKYLPRVNEVIEKYLDSDEEISDDNKYKAMNQLILNSHIGGLIEFKKRYKNTYFDSYFFNSKWYNSLAKISFKVSIEHWEEILQTALKANKNINSFHRRELEGIVFGIFSIYSSNNEEIFNQIRVKIEKYIQEDNDNSSFLKTKLHDFKNEYYSSKIDISTIANAQSFCEEIGLVYEA
jgi:hypothetical protein